MDFAILYAKLICVNCFAQFLHKVTIFFVITNILSKKKRNFATQILTKWYQKPFFRIKL